MRRNSCTGGYTGNNLVDLNGERRAGPDHKYREHSLRISRAGVPASTVQLGNGKGAFRRKDELPPPPASA